VLSQLLSLLEVLRNSFSRPFPLPFSPIGDFFLGFLEAEFPLPSSTENMRDLELSRKLFGAGQPSLDDDCTSSFSAGRIGMSPFLGRR